MAVERRRPDPDLLLAQVAASEEDGRRGRLKVFLGAAPGVGKTYAMLTAARDLRRQGIDVVVGIVETHGRQETQVLLEGLEVLPRRRLEYKGRAFEELDLDALLKRRPEVALVDELAHTNVPGSRHERRYQDVEELLAARIDVLTTVNVQHFESLNDVVAQITGVRVRETVPDAFFDRPHDVVLIDLPPRELIERLRQGKVYVPELARAALQAFFSPSNLAALRELAMQTAAERIDEEFRDALLAHGVAAGAPIRRRVLVAVDGHEHTEYLVRRARRFAERRQMPWTVAYVESPRSARTDREALQAAFELARRLGGDTVVLRGGGVVEEVLRYAQRHGVSSILIGQTRERPIARIFKRTVTQQLLEKGASFELTIVNTPTLRVRSRRWLRGEERWPPRAHEVGLATGATAAACLVAAGLQRWLPVPTLALVFITAVLAVAVRSRRSVAVYAAVLGFLAYNFFFTEPRLTLRIARGEDLAAVTAFLIAALVCSQLAARLRGQVVRLRAAHDLTRALQSLGERLAGAADEGQVFGAGCEELAMALGCEVVALRRSEREDGLRVVGRRPDGARLEPNDLAAADWVARHAQQAGRYTSTLSASPWWLVPLIVESGCLGVVGLRFPPAQGVLTAEQRQLAEAMIRQIALAGDRAALVADLETARVEGETERLRTALLSSVSHDLRSPLASVIGAASSLSAYGDTMPLEDRRQLLESIRGEGERLDRYIQNLLDMTRLGAGGLKLQRDWIAVDELLGSAVRRAGKLFPAVRFESRVEAELPLLYVHPALVEQALFNILENAAKFSPPGAPVVTTAARDGNKLVLEVTDRGPGIPEEERRRVFDMFYSAERGDQGRGTGLGLTIVRGMIGAHAGRVEALAGPQGVGTVIRVTLPVPEAPPRPDPGDEGE